MLGSPGKDTQQQILPRTECSKLGVGSDFNFDFSASYTREQQHEGIEYNFDSEPALRWRRGQEGGGEGAEAQFAAMCGIDAPEYARNRPGMSAFVFEDGAVYHAYSIYARAALTPYGL